MIIFDLICTLGQIIHVCVFPSVITLVCVLTWLKSPLSALEDICIFFLLFILSPINKKTARMSQCFYLSIIPTHIIHVY